ncbi:MAG: tetrahydrofolate dehydrogenase/cyclohydrolase catalytic domain-containing protein [Desulfitobacteriaceae bacterium]|nr:tetrahydrofolate dehydrogenase/cyclohydrolase catalytic domain-containing protein [Desulfitobacteriaceae bacterium]MDI6915608.1 tetrahydrofolate dehydrogenase/cyclohydrolase catalytic domain-containing protein [Desulfitobacteriaceae bacterium]
MHFQRNFEALAEDLDYLFSRLSIQVCLAVVSANPKTFHILDEICQELPVILFEHLLQENARDKDAIKKIEEWNKISGIHGIFIDRPLPSHFQEEKILNTIRPIKNVTMNLTQPLTSIFNGQNEDKETALLVLEKTFDLAILQRGKRV